MPATPTASKSTSPQLIHSTCRSKNSSCNLHAHASPSLSSSSSSPPPPSSSPPPHPFRCRLLKVDTEGMEAEVAPPPFPPHPPTHTLTPPTGAARRRQDHQTVQTRNLLQSCVRQPPSPHPPLLTPPPPFSYDEEANILSPKTQTAARLIKSLKSAHANACVSRPFAPFAVTRGA